MNKYLLYRICSTSNAKPRIEGFSKILCLDNLLSTFPNYRMICIADNCDDETISLLEKKNFYHFESTKLGQIHSFRHLIRYAIQNFDADDVVYVIEDDYWHLENSNTILDEGLGVFDYVALYDHPDKYADFKYSKNPYVTDRHLSEATQIYRGKHVLWRTTNSTTHSFACKVLTLRDDSYIWLGIYSRRKFLNDFYDWTFLTQPGFNSGNLRLKYLLRQCVARMALLFGAKKRTLGIPMPSMSAHLESNLIPHGFEFKAIKTG